MRLRWLRLLLALCALGAALASPVAVARAMAAPAPAMSGPVLPCHETASEMAQTVTPVQKPAASHLCCVLTQTVVPPLSAPALPVPEAVSARPAVPAETKLAGLAPRIPVPPPRVL